jgi:anti-sigma B factor antagonist
MSMDGHGPAVLNATPGPMPDGVTLRLAGELDVATARHLPEIVRALPADLVRHVRLDLAELSFIDASGLTALIETRTLVHGRGGQLSLQDPRPALVRLLEIADLAATFGLRTAMSVEDR